ncbi:unnamed protein product [Miscanthus lutarioriparius]|uniref:Legume lectin domain-containing protein n=1 Tax=Miscanthus lutarioriparius TaxID=422564 RepID=A0A811Q525_9POAL|nr:unnamed protein product [Miscanthus lutarioriparius]
MTRAPPCSRSSSSSPSSSLPPPPPPPPPSTATRPNPPRHRPPPTSSRLLLYPLHLPHHARAHTYGDGLAFLLTSSRTFLGASNGFLGLFPSSSASDEGEADLRGVTTVAVEFDTHRDVALRDPDGNHVALDAGSIFSVASASPGVDLRSGVPIIAWVEYRAPRRRLSVWLSYSSFRRPEKPALSADADLSGLLRTYMYAGFSASNGNGAALHVIERWTFCTFGFANSSRASPPSEPPAQPNKALLPPNSKPLLLTGSHQHHHLIYKVLGGVLGGMVLLVFAIVASVVWLSRPARRPTEERTVPPSEDKPYGTMSMEVEATWYVKGSQDA